MKSTVLRFDKAGTTENSLSLHDDLQVFIKGLMCNDMQALSARQIYSIFVLYFFYGKLKLWKFTNALPTA